MSEQIGKKFDAQVDYGWGLSLKMTGKAPAISKRIFDKLSDAQNFTDDYNDSAIEGLILAVVSDGKNNGIYFVERIKKSAEDEPSKLIKVAHDDKKLSVESYDEALELATVDNIGHVVYVKEESYYEDSDNDIIEFKPSPYIIVGEKSLIKLITNIEFENIENEVDNLKSNDEKLKNEINDIKEKLDGLSSTDKELQTNTNELIDIVNEIREVYATKEYVDGKVDGKFDAAGSAIQALADAKADAANLYQVKGNYEVAGTAASLNAVMDKRVTELEKINHNDYVTEEKLASKGYLTSDVADKKYAPIDTTGSGESIDLSKYAEIEYVNNNFDAAGSAAAAEISAKAYADSLATNYDAVGAAAQALNDAKADAAEKYQVKGDYEAAGTAAGLDAAMDARVKVLEKIDHSVYLTEHQDISGKQDAIADLADIRANATLAKTALQSVPEEYITEEELEAKGYITSVNMDGKQDVISDLEEIRSNAELAKTALQSVPEEYVTNEELTNQGYAKKSDIPKLEWLIFD